MATTNKRITRSAGGAPRRAGTGSDTGSGGLWGRAVLVAALILGGAAWYYSTEIKGYSAAATAYGARTACSCRHIGGREMASCKQDLLPGMSMVFLSENADERSVTARVPLIAANTARFRDGFGCVLDPWEG